MNLIQKALKIYNTYGFKGIKGAFAQKFKEEILDFRIRPILLKRRVKHIYGPTEISYAPDELIVICLLRNGELYLKSFVEHYKALGVKHLVFMDNMSTDRTLEILSSYEGVTVLQTDVTFITYETSIRRYLAERFSQGRWNLVSDIDELFDYPYSDQLSLSDFLKYLNENHYTAVIAQMLDMFSEQPLSQITSDPNDSLAEKYPYYDISDIDKDEYIWSPPPNRKIMMHWGGLRKTFFGTYSGLTKAAMIFMDGNLKPFVGWHHAKNAQVADISCVLKHYQFLSSFYDKVKDSIENERYGKKGVKDFYDKIQKVLKTNPDLDLKLDTAQKLSDLEQLIDTEFLIVSEQYRQWVKIHQSNH